MSSESSIPSISDQLYHDIMYLGKFHGHGVSRLEYWLSVASPGKRSVIRGNNREVFIGYWEWDTDCKIVRRE